MKNEHLGKERNMRTWMVTLVLLALLAGCGDDGHWRASTRFDDEVSIGEMLYVTDPNAAIGICAVYGEAEGTDAATRAVGATIRFALRDVAEAVANTTLPGQWSLEGVPVQPWGTLAGGWNFDQDQTWWAIGTGTEFLVTPTVRPYISADIYHDLGVDENARIMLGVVVDIP